jgi:hypothetical protein
MTSKLLKVLACVSMVVDHIGWLLFPGIEILRIIGRISFPLFAFVIAFSVTRTKSISKYTLRLLILGLIAQPIYSWANYLTGTTVYELNIFFTLLLGIISVTILSKKQYLGVGIVAVGLILIISFLVPMDYGLVGVLLIIMFWVTLEILGKYGHYYSVIALMIFNSIYSLITPVASSRHWWSMLAVIPLVLFTQIKPKTSKLWKYAFYIFYPIHLLIICVIFVLINQL